MEFRHGAHDDTCGACGTLVRAPQAACAAEQQIHAEDVAPHAASA